MEHYHLNERQPDVDELVLGFDHIGKVAMVRLTKNRYLEDSDEYTHYWEENETGTQYDLDDLPYWSYFEPLPDDTERQYVDVFLNEQKIDDEEQSLSGIPGFKIVGSTIIKE